MAVPTRLLPPRAFPVLLAYLGVYGAWQVLGWGGAGTRSLIGDLAFIPLIGAAVALTWRASTRCIAQPRLRAGWRLIAAGLFAYFVGNLIQMIYEVGFSTRPYPSVEDVAYLSFYPLTFLGLLRFRVGRVTRVERRKLLVDSALVVVGGGALIWYVVLGPTAVEASGSVVQTVFSIAYPLGDLLLVLALSNVLLRRIAQAVHVPVGWIGVGLLFFVVGDLIYGWVSIHGTYHGGDPIDAFWMVSIGIFGLAAAAQPVALPAVEPEVDDDASHGWAWLPHLGLGTVLGLIVVSEIGEPFFPTGSLTVCGVVAAVLVGIRQYLAHRELLNTHSELADAHLELAALATTDPVTGLANHRALIAAIDRELERSRRYGRPCAVLFLDIDHFKALNDAWGHAAGDAALRELGYMAGDALRGMDIVGRWGGEEFVALLPEADAESALAAAERVRRAIAGHRFAAAGGAHLTCSLGVAVFPDDGEDRETLLDTADHAMYTAKRLGRNQAIGANDPAVTALASANDGSEVALMDAVETIARLVDVRDHYTGAHAADVAALARRLALLVGAGVREAQTVGLAARLHDVGKVAIADAILQKPGRLTEDEWRQMREHPILGADVVSRIPSLRTIAPLVRGHHERWDGAGYPDGLAGEEIPLGARIIAIADAYDAMVSGRPYRPAISPDEAMAELDRCAGSQFDPSLVTLMRGALAPARVHATI